MIPTPGWGLECFHQKAKLSVQKAAQTLEEIRTILHTNYPLLAPLTP